MPDKQSADLLLRFDWNFNLIPHTRTQPVTLELAAKKRLFFFVPCLQTNSSTNETLAAAEFVSHLTLAADGASARLSFPLSGRLGSFCPLSFLPQTWGSVEGNIMDSWGKDFIYVFRRRRRRSGVLTAVDHRWRGRQGLVMFTLVKSGVLHRI